MMKVEIYGNLDEVVRELIRFRNAGFDVYCEFNGHKLYSRDISMDSAYLEVCGCTYSEYLRRRKEWLQEYEERKRKEKEESKAKKPEWIARGRKLIPEELWSKWEECIDIRISDLYNGMEVESALQVMEAHASGASAKDILQMTYDQGHSGMSYSMLRSIVTFFYPAGKQLFEEIAKIEDSKKLS